MNGVHAKLQLIAVAGSLFFSNSMVAQGTPYSPKEILPPAPKAASVKITQGPELELVRSNWAIIRWSTNNPGGTDQHNAIVHFGTSPSDLSQTAKSPIHINREHSDALFRVRVLGLSPQTTYYYRVDSTESNGNSDGVESPVKQFSTP
jgi:phosphodiesterase/alkaline phosphatase D-like protein